jgi:hypothetical protein
VASVNIISGRILLEEGLTSDMMIIRNSDTGEYEKEITLYFPMPTAGLFFRKKDSSPSQLPSHWLNM